MKSLLIGLLTVVFTGFVSAQRHYVDSLHNEISRAKEDTNTVLAFFYLAEYYGFNDFDSCFFYSHKALNLSEKLNYDYGSSLAYRSLFYAYNCQGNYPKALEVTLQNLKIAEKLKLERPQNYFAVTYMLGLLNKEMDNIPVAISRFENAINVYNASGREKEFVWPAYVQLALIYQNMNMPDSALSYAQKGYSYSNSLIWRGRFIMLPTAVLGEIYRELGNYDLARKYFYLGAEQSRRLNNNYFLARNYNDLATLFYKTGHLDSSIYYGRISLEICQQHNFSEYALNASSLLTNIYESQNRPDSTIKYMKIKLASKDSVLGQSKVKEFQKVVFDDEQGKQEIQQEEERQKNKTRTIALLLSLAVFLVIAFILYRNNQQKQKSNIVLQKTLSDLRTTQKQLIQSEKMASLGELTAGIAHEIQNPLNFVNNFSDMNEELLTELNEEIKKGNYNEVETIAKDIIDNERKINNHGKRADAIVKGMLQHSRSSSGIKEPADINALANEYLRLAYHGMRAKDNSFNATLKTDFDTSIGKINIIPQDIGRVMLNLINNAFYAVDEKKKSGIENYEPIVTVSTKTVKPPLGGLGAEIKVKDNGNGIPQKVLDKIFQPFFTTKPTGQGTGLGLSLAYDIVKAHGGELKVETNEREGSEFIVRLTGR